MKSSSLLILLIFWTDFSLMGQSFNCTLVNDTLYIISFDIRSSTNYPVGMSGVSKSPEITNFSKKNVMSFINSFYEKCYYLPDVFGGHKKMILECMGVDSGNNYLKLYPLATSNITNSLIKKSKKRNFVLESGETVFLNIVKVYGSFWIVNKNWPGIITNSNEVNIKEINGIEKCYMPFEIRCCKRTLK